MIGANRFMAHVVLRRALELNPSYEQDEAFYFMYSVRSAKKPADVISGGKDFLEKFPKSSYVPEALYLIGEAYSNMRKPWQGRPYFKRLTDEFPETEWGARAARKLK